MSAIRINLLTALRGKTEPLLVCVLVSTVANITREQSGDVEGILNVMVADGLITTTTDVASDLPAAMLTTRGQAVANQLR